MTSIQQKQKYEHPLSLLWNVLSLNYVLMRNIIIFWCMLMYLGVVSTASNIISISILGRENSDEELDPVLKIIVLLLATTLLTLAFEVLRPFSFYITQTTIRDPLSTALFKDVMTTVYKFHPLWLASIGGGSSVDKHIVSKGLQCFASITNRFSYFGPMIFSFIGAIWSLGYVSMRVALTLTAFLVCFQFFVAIPTRNAIFSDLRHLNRNVRFRFVMMETLEFGRLQARRTRGSAEYETSVARLSAYQLYRSRVLYKNYYREACCSAAFRVITEVAIIIAVGYALIPQSYIETMNVATVVTDVCREIWSMIPLHVSGEIKATPPSLYSSQHSANEGEGFSVVQGIVVVTLLQAARRVVDSLSNVLEHSKHTMNELSAYEAVPKAFESAFSLSESTTAATMDLVKKVKERCHETRCSARIKLVLQENSFLTVSTPGSGIVHSIVIKEAFVTIASGDLIFVNGPNGVGKSILLAALCGRIDGLAQASHSAEFRRLGFGNSEVMASIEIDGETVTSVPSALSLAAFAQSDLVCEFNQSIEGTNLAGTNEVVTLGDVMLRMNGLLLNCTSTDYQLRPVSNQEASMHFMYKAMLGAINAVGIQDRLVDKETFSYENEDPVLGIKQRYEALCSISLAGLSGGEQQRLRLASLFLLEKLRYETYHKHVDPDLFDAQTVLTPMRLLLLDEPDHQIDKDFHEMFATLLGLLHPEHLQQLAVLLVAHTKNDPKPYANLDGILSIKTFNVSEKVPVEVPTAPEAFGVDIIVMEAKEKSMQYTQSSLTHTRLV